MLRHDYVMTHPLRNHYVIVTLWLQTYPKDLKQYFMIHINIWRHYNGLIIMQWLRNELLITLLLCDGQKWTKITLDWHSMTLFDII